MKALLTSSQNCAAIFTTEYVAEIYQAFVTSSKQDLQLVADELKQIVPEALHSMLDKQTKEEALQKHQERKQKETVISPATCSGKKNNMYNTLPLVKILRIFKDRQRSS